MKTGTPYRFTVFFLVFFIFMFRSLSAQFLKSIVYDFDGFDTGATSLPEGDYSYGDLTYAVAANPLPAGAMLGDRVLQLNLGWNAGYGAFGRGISRYIELNKDQDRFNFYFYNPATNAQDAIVEIKLADDDNQDYQYNSASDDSWVKTFSLSPAPGWQLITVPLKDFTDDNSGGNGIFDIAFTQNKGMLLLAEIRFSRPSPTAGNAVFYIDMICFSDGPLPTGAKVTDLPPKNPGDHCLLGAYQKENPGEDHLIPSKFEALFPPVEGKKIRYVNTFIQWGTNGSATAHQMPGNGYQQMINNGYRPVITWEPMFAGYATLDPVQPRLSNIINGDYNTYIDAFADKIKTYTDTVIIRLMHEFDGDWYPWCVSQNNEDPQKFVMAFRKIVDRFRAKGANNVKWMWSPNSDYAPYRHWNWIVSAYPGDNYVDITGSSVYNAHYPDTLPWWRSFRWVAAESYYYLRKYFPSKPFFIAEFACRERLEQENPVSQTKAGWFAETDKLLQSQFHQTRAIVFFSHNKTQTWKLNTSSAALQSVTDNIWMDDYYFIPKSGPIAIQEQQSEILREVYPNPTEGIVKIRFVNRDRWGHHARIYNYYGQEMNVAAISRNDDGIIVLDLSEYPEGIYFVEVFSVEDNGQRLFHKVLKR